MENRDGGVERPYDRTVSITSENLKHYAYIISLPYQNARNLLMALYQTLRYLRETVFTANYSRTKGSRPS
jgi:hypothetical protein